MRSVTVQVCHILFLALHIPDGDIPGRHCRLCGAICMPFMICTSQQIVGHISHKLATDTATSADIHALVFNFVISSIFNITET